MQYNSVDYNNNDDDDEDDDYYYYYNDSYDYNDYHFENGEGFLLIFLFKLNFYLRSFCRLNKIENVSLYYCHTYLLG